MVYKKLKSPSYTGQKRLPSRLVWNYQPIQVSHSGGVVWGTLPSASLFNGHCHLRQMGGKIQFFTNFFHGNKNNPGKLLKHFNTTNKTGINDRTFPVCNRMNAIKTTNKL